MSIVANPAEVNQQVRKKVILTKPTIEEIISTYIEVNENLEKNGKRYMDEDDKGITKPWLDIVKENQRYLSVMRLEDYDQKNFDMLIASIELNGKKHFNMQMFIGMVDNLQSHFEEDLDSRAYGDNTTSHGLHSDWLSPVSEKYAPFYSTTKAFNCDTVGCIAGFAVATALDWKEDLIQKSSKYYSNQQELFENVACNFLNMPVIMGKKLFYAEGNSFWAMLANRALDFPSNSDIAIFRDLDTESYIEEDFDYDPVNLASITHEMAAKALQLIKDGSIELTDNNIPYLTAGYRNKLTQEIPVDAREVN